MPHMNIAFAIVNGGFALGLAGCCAGDGFLLVLAYIIVVFCSFDNFTLNWLDPFSVIYMAKAGVMVTTI